MRLPARTPAVVARLLSPASLGWTMALTATLCFSTVTPLGKAAVAGGLPSSAIVVLRLVITVALLGANLLRGGGRRLRADPRTLWVSLAIGLSNGVGMLTYFGSLAYISSSVASMIFSLSPLVTLVLLALRGEAFTGRHAIRLALGLGGVFLLIGPGGQVNAFGALLAAFSVFTVPIQLVLIQWFLPDGDAEVSSFYMMATMAVTALVGWLWQGAPWQAPTLTGWLLVAGITLIGTYAGRLMMFVAIQRLGGGQFGLLAPLETLVTVFWSVLFLQERLTVPQWLGGGLILISALLAVQRLGRLRLRWRRGRLSAESKPEA